MTTMTLPNLGALTFDEGGVADTTLDVNGVTVEVDVWFEHSPEATAVAPLDRIDTSETCFIFPIRSFQVPTSPSPLDSGLDQKRGSRRHEETFARWSMFPSLAIDNRARAAQPARSVSGRDRLKSLLILRFSRPWVRGADVREGAIVRRQRLGGMLSFYHREAA